MRLPRDLSGSDLVRHLQPLGYVTTRQTGSHIRLTTQQNGEHHITIPNHPALRIGTLAAILLDISQHFGIDRDELSRRLFN
jgi:predicted RNA binding protein YcfA (HicA-like mRNA interferase family)